MALGKLFRTTVFKISLAYLAISAVGASLVLGTVGWNMKSVIEEQIARTIDTNIAGLSEQYAQGGILRLVHIIQRRTRRPGAGLYLVTTPAGEPIAGNIVSLPPDILAHPGLVEMAYQPPGDASGKHRALVRIFVLDGGFHLLVGHDLEEGERLRHILGDALLSSLVWLVVIGTLGGLWVARRVLNRVDAINANARAIVAGDLSGRLRLAGTGDELDRLVQNFNAMLERIAILMAGLKEVSDNIAHDLKTPLTR
ncbi:MAG TPA: HAMP domain-containing protein, partial [Methylocella sp.]|nr:HAMP domain-containing protein [Methylocella sp.]